MEMKRVAVIGAGPAGLAALRHLTAKPHMFSPVAFEKSDVIGGTWVYTDNIGCHNKGMPIHTSMYKNVKTNLPKELVQFDGYPLREELPSFVPHEDMLSYMEDMTDHFGLKKYIRFNTLVASVKPIKGGDGFERWEVKTRDISKRGNEYDCVEIFDLIMVCVGQFSVPRIPNIPGDDIFQGQIIHSHDYRVPDAFKGKRVVVLGAGPSGSEIAIDIAESASEVLLSHNNAKLDLPPIANLRQASGVSRLTHDSAVMKDGEEYQMDVLLLCTGYKKSFPFLTPECHLISEDTRVYPLYKHVIHAEYPSMAVIGMCEYFMAFLHFESQIKFALSAWEGTYQLPSREDMKVDIEKDLAWRVVNGYPPHRPHFLGALSRQYENELAMLGQFDPYSSYTYDLFETIMGYAATGLLEYMTVELPKTASGQTDMKKLATFPSFVKNLRNGTIDQASDDVFQIV